MRIVIVTGTEPTHQHFCAELGRRFSIERILHPQPPPKKTSAFRKLQDRLKVYGPTLVILHYLASIESPISGWRPDRQRRRIDQEYFSGAASRFAALADRCIAVRDVNGPETVQMIRELNPDVTICLGGPIYRKAFIQASRLVLNYHSGLSPIYNGAETIPFAFANGHPHLCGGTLMVMNELVDGGDILGHYLPEITASDTPATLFGKGITGAAEIVCGFLNHYSTVGQFQKVAQPAPLFYCRSTERELHHTHSILKHIKTGLCQKHLRKARINSYWDKPTPEAAERALFAFLNEMLFGVPSSK